MLVCRNAVSVVESGEGRSSDADFVGRLTPLTFRTTGSRVCSENRGFSVVKGLSRASICRSAAFGCGGSIPSLPTDFAPSLLRFVEVRPLGAKGASAFGVRTGG